MKLIKAGSIPSMFLIGLALFCLACAPAPTPPASPPAPPQPVSTPAAQEQPAGPKPVTPPADAAPAKKVTVQYLGHSCFYITSSGGFRVITDPYGQGMWGYKLTFSPIVEEADVVTVSHQHWDHNNVEAVKGQPVKVEEPGSVKVKDVVFKVIPAWHDMNKTNPDNIVTFTIDGVRFCHLGDLGAKLDSKQLAEIGAVDVLFVPVGGGGFALNATRATEVSKELNPRIIIPMHFKTAKTGFEIDSVDLFLEGKTNARRAGSSILEITANKLPADSQIVVLDAAK